MSNDHSFLSEALIDAVTSQWGETGRVWLTQLPQQIQHLAQQLGLSELQLDPRSRLHWLGHALMKGKAITLKLGVPDPDWRQEYHALLRFQDLPQTVRLLTGEPTAGWYIMEHIIPGTPLSELSDDLWALQLWRKNLTFLPAQTHDQDFFVSLEAWTAELYEPVSDCLATEVDQVRNICSELLKTEERNYLLHGDLHHHNLLYSQQHGWKLIDPKGVVDSPEFEFGAMLRNPYPRWNQAADLDLQLLKRFEMIKQHCEFDFDRVKKWAYVQAVLAACWSKTQPPAAQLWLRLAKVLATLNVDSE